MGDERWDLLRNRPCLHLRSKEMFYDSPTADDAAYDSGLFWCERTCTSLGPDANPAEKAACGPDRACYER